MHLLTFVTTICVVVCCAAPASAHKMSYEAAAKLLRSDDEGKRQEAVGHLLARPPHPRIIPILLRRAAIETDPGLYRNMLLLLGKSGFMEVRPMIDRHILSPDRGLRNAARRALKEWLLANRLIAEDDDLPDPPHPMYGPPPPLPAAAPAGRSLQNLLGGGTTTEEGEHLPLPRYHPPPPGAPWGAMSDTLHVAPGFVAEDRPHPGPLAAGLSTWGLGWLFAVVPTAIGAVFDDIDYAVAVVPLAGPFVALGVSDDLENEDTRRAFFGVSGAAQIIGLAIVPIAFAVDWVKVRPRFGGIEASYAF